MNKSGINKSLPQLLTLVYPEYEWLPWRFQHPVPTGFWKDEGNQIKFVEWAGTQFQIKEMSDWYKITINVKNGGKNDFLNFLGFYKNWRSRAVKLF